MSSRFEKGVRLVVLIGDMTIGDSMSGDAMVCKIFGSCAFVVDVLVTGLWRWELDRVKRQPEAVAVDVVCAAVFCPGSDAVSLVTSLLLLRSPSARSQPCVWCLSH